MRLNWLLRSMARDDESCGIWVYFFSASTWRMFLRSSTQVLCGCLWRERTMLLVQAPPAPPGPLSLGSPKEDTSYTSALVCSSLHPLNMRTSAAMIWAALDANSWASPVLGGLKPSLPPAAKAMSPAMPVAPPAAPAPPAPPIMPAAMPAMPAIPDCASPPAARAPASPSTLYLSPSAPASLAASCAAFWHLLRHGPILADDASWLGGGSEKGLLRALRGLDASGDGRAG
mmetsp:Transcript_19489/g.47782  ORF Transcript_19489/g.47782 Transcript_19489/m.47782 type:complete len:230 (+) Transcript_19489:892-1581(+)